MAETQTTNTTETTTTPEIDYKAKFEELEGKYSSLKTSFDKTSSENADYKRKERERMSDEAKSKADQEERDNYYKGLERRLALRDYADELDDVTDTKTKDKIVDLLADGKILDALKAFKEFRAKYKTELEKQIRAELLAQNPQTMAQSSGGGYKTQAEIMAIKDSEERQRAIAENSHLFVRTK